MLKTEDLAILLTLAKTGKQRSFMLALIAVRQVERPLVPDVRFVMTACADSNVILDFRFDVAGVQKLGQLLGIPAVFGRSRESLCDIFLHMINTI
ncbi:hypothetical protein ACHHYP_13406 [Achlya hypogyna]|uniref:Uncharacterized protein n=1 Tax=Achlya hypogyna TaxID=1202772 RepID=A0A1V9YFD2_ACHHY|nr:hypothetical protein ACHHYP_13406 [Achlya hypogyna]